MHIRRLSLSKRHLSPTPLIRIRPHHYPTQRITLKNRQVVTPTPKQLQRIDRELTRIHTDLRHWSPALHVDVAFSTPLKGVLTAPSARAASSTASRASPTAASTSPPPQAPPSAPPSEGPYSIPATTTSTARPCSLITAATGHHVLPPQPRRRPSGSARQGWADHRAGRAYWPRHRPQPPLGRQPRRRPGQPAPLSAQAGRHRSARARPARKIRPGADPKLASAPVS